MNDTGWDTPNGNASVVGDGAVDWEYHSGSTRPGIYCISTAFDSTPGSAISHQMDSVDVGATVVSFTLEINGAVIYESDSGGGSTGSGGTGSGGTGFSDGGTAPGQTSVPAGTGFYDPPVNRQPTVVGDINWIGAHPRMIPGGSLANLQAKMADSAYDSIRPTIQANASNKYRIAAFNYLVYGDVTQGEYARDRLLSGLSVADGGIHDQPGTSDAWSAWMIWDWCYPLFDAGQRTTAMGHLRHQVRHIAQRLRRPVRRGSDIPKRFACSRPDARDHTCASLLRRR